jgi:DNA replication and repair protein RecF
LSNGSTYTGTLNTNGHKWFIDNKPTKRKLDTSAVFINPFDSYSFHHQASFRRHWFDQHIGIYNKEFKTVLNKYNTALRFRNALLGKRSQTYDVQMESIDKQIVEYSVVLIQYREDFLTNINQYLSETFKKIFDHEHFLKMEIKSKFKGLTASEIKDFLKNNFEKDNAIGHTSSGVHKDDYIFFFDGMSSYEYCSLGQQKMSFLSLIFAFIDLFRAKYGVYPMVLIDDVSGELDSLRWKNLIQYLEAKKFQVFITTANEAFEKELIQKRMPTKFILLMAI